MSQGIRFFDPLSPEEERAVNREKWRGILKLISVRPEHRREDASAVAMGMKTHGPDAEEPYIEWAKENGIRRHRAKQIWDSVSPETDAFEELIEAFETERNWKDRFELLTASSIAESPQPDWCVKSLLPKAGLASFYGPSTSGKSFLALAFAIAIALGIPIFGYSTKATRVLYIALEGEAGYRGRVLAWQRCFGRAMPDNIRFLLQPFRLTDPQDVADLAAKCPPDTVVFIDTLNRAAPGLDENSSRDMGAVIDGAKTLQQLIGGLVVLIAHTGKDSAKGLRGHSSLFAALDAAILVSREGDVRSWKVDKAKDGKDGEAHRFILQVVEVGTDEDGDAITSCVVLPDSSSPTTYEKPLTDNQKLGLQSFREAAAAHGGVDDQGNFIGLHLSNWRPVFYRMSPADNDSAKKKAFERVRKDLIGRGRLMVENNVYRLAGDGAELEEKCIAATLNAASDMGTGMGRAGDTSPIGQTYLGTTATTPL